jgi:hypothetical protein
VTTIDCVVSPEDQEYALPLFAVSVTLPPLQNVVGPLGVMVADGVETLTVKLFDAAGQLVTLTVTLSVIGVAVFASKVTTFDVAPAVIAPLVAVQRYVAPGTAGIEAVWPVVFAQTVAGAVIGGVPGQPVTPTETVPELLAVLDSGVEVLTVAVFETVVPVAGAVTLIVIAGMLLPAPSAPAVQVIVVVPLQLQPLALIEFNVTSTGSVSTTVTSFAAPAPLFETLSV